MLQRTGKEIKKFDFLGRYFHKTGKNTLKQWVMKQATLAFFLKFYCKKANIINERFHAHHRKKQYRKKYSLQK